MERLENTPDSLAKSVINHLDEALADWDNQPENSIIALIKLDARVGRFRPSDLSEITYRQINSWAKAGIFHEYREGNNGWRKFSEIDMAWLHLAQELRTYGLSLDSLRRAFKCAFYRGMDEESPWNMLELSLYLCRKDVGIYLKVQSDGIAEFMTLAEYFADFSRRGPKKQYGHILISLNRLWAKNFNSISGKTIHDVQLFNDLSPEERRLIAKIRVPESAAITVHKKDGKIAKYETQTLVGKDGQRIGQILGDIDYGTVTIYKAADAITHISVTEMEKP